MKPLNSNQLGFFGLETAVVHYFDKNGALRTGKFIRRITKGKNKGRIIVENTDGRQIAPRRIRNIDYTDV